eukprot:gb/GECG01014622.1/.p1 GENE.gb/GECG01014622.1/~~gb/GECG01014622.1/.p1  ORF type:complete len:147 (+),score=10.53 gb/GECG01014622.1/:1-441(+)
MTTCSEEMNTILGIAGSALSDETTYKLLEQLMTEQKKIGENIDSLKKASLLVARDTTQNKLYRLDVWAPSKRNRDDQKSFKDSLIKFYQRAAGGDKLRCQLVNRPYPATMVRAAHIWKAATHGRGKYRRMDVICILTIDRTCFTPC